MEKRSAEEKINIYVRSSKRRNLSSSDEHPENCKYKLLWLQILPGYINTYVVSNIKCQPSIIFAGELNSSLSNVTSQVLEDLGKKEEAKNPIENQPVAKRVTRSQAKASKNEEDCDLKRKNPCSSNAKSEESK